MITDLKDTLRRQNEQIDQLRDEVTHAESKEREARHNNETFGKKISDLQSQLQKLTLIEQKQTARSTTDGGQSGKQGDTSTLMQHKLKEIYNLTVELGSLREENNELRKNVEQQKTDFQERLQEQRDRHEVEYNKVVDELELLKIESEERLDAAKQKIEQLTQQLKSFENQGN